MDTYFLFDARGVPLLDVGHDLGLTALSVMVAVLAGMTALHLLDLARREPPGTRLHRLALAGGGLALGLGAWAMHFIGMLALQLCVRVAYDPGLTMLSALPAIAGATLALHLLATRPAVLLPAAALAAGVGATHYLGMAALRTAPLLLHHPGVFGLSLALALALGVAALEVHRRLGLAPRRAWACRLLLGGLALGLALSAMHYVAMLGLRVVGQAETTQALPPEGGGLLALWLALAVGAVSALAVAVQLAMRFRAAAHALASREAQLQALVTNVPGTTFRSWRDAQQRIVIDFVSDEVQALTGWPAQALRGGEVAFDALLHPADRARVVAQARQALDAGQGYQLDYRVIDRLGHEHWVHESTAVVPDPLVGHPWLVGVIMDVTAARQRSAEFEGVVAALRRDLCVIEFDPGGRVVEVNDGFLALTGHRREALLGQPHAELRPEGEAATLAYAEHWRRLRAGEHVAGQFQLLRADGRPLWVHATYNPILDLDGQVRRVMKFVTDMSPQRALEAELRAAKERAEQAAQAKSAFLANMSHEIRTPLNGVIGLTEILQQSRLDAGQQETADLIKDSAYSLLGIIEDILDFSKIEAGRLELERVPIEPARVVEQVCAMLDQVAAKKGVELTLFTDPAVPAWVLGDALRLRQVLVNLANNAIKFSSGPQRRGRVHVGLTRAADAALLLSVRDDGIGMDAATQARLFQPFMQADVSTTRHFGGTGLGLAITQALVQAFGGRVALQSAPGAGSTFTVTLPLPAAAPPPGAAQAAPAAAPVLPWAGLQVFTVGPPAAGVHALGAYLRAEGADLAAPCDLAQA
ncbi:MHYT domain-containing protein, partial [Ideonella livida]